MRSYLFEAPTCHVFSLPEDDSVMLQSEAWEGLHIWTGRIRVVHDDAAGGTVAIELIEADTDAVFGVCPYLVSGSTSSDPRSVQQAKDSSRCFVIRLEQGEDHAYIGLNFADRNYAFQFSAALADAVRNERKAHTAAEALPVGDRSLKQGEFITVDLDGKVKGAAANATALNAPPSSKFNLSAPPPPVAATTGASRRLSSMSKQPATTTPAAASSTTPSSASGTQGRPVAAPTAGTVTATAAPVAAAVPFLELVDFGTAVASRGPAPAVAVPPTPVVDPMDSLFAPSPVPAVSSRTTATTGGAAGTSTAAPPATTGGGGGIDEIFGPPVSTTTTTTTTSRPPPASRQDAGTIDAIFGGVASSSSAGGATTVMPPPPVRNPAFDPFASAAPTATTTTRTASTASGSVASAPSTGGSYFAPDPPAKKPSPFDELFKMT